MIKLGIVGTNFVSDWMADAVAVSDGIVSQAVYSRSDETGTAFALRHDIPDVFTSYEDMISSGIDAVYIASPNSLHFSQALYAVEHGVNVLVEKPAVLCEKDFETLVSAAGRNGAVLMEAMRPAHDPDIIALKDNLDRLGTVRRAVFEFCQYSSRYDRFKAGEIMNAFDPSFGNAAVMDIGVYAIHACVMTFGEPRGISSGSFLFPNGMEGCGKAVLEYDGFSADIVYSKIYDSVTPSFISGEKGSLIIGKISTGENIRLKLKGQEEIRLSGERPATPELNMIYEVKDFVDAVERKTDTAVFNGNTRLTLRIIDEIRRQNGIRFE